MRNLITTGLFLTILGSSAAMAGNQQAVTEQMVDAKYKELQRVLNDRADYEGAINFLHSHISDDASFTVTVSNPVAQKGETSPVMVLNKQDYINSYIQGTQFVDDYEFAIMTKGFKYDEAKKEAVTMDIMVERGKMPNEMNNERPFVSRTLCRTEHVLEGDMLVSKAAECHTDISFEEDI